MKVNVETILSCGTMASVELPISSWQEVKSFFVKWDILHYTLDGENWHEVSLNSPPDDIIDWKHPVQVTILMDDYNVLSVTR